MKKTALTIIISLMGLTGLKAQISPSFGIKFSGYIRTDVIYDTRQSSASNGLREGHFYLFPDNFLYDATGVDVNASPSFHMLSIQSRLKGDIQGPDAFGAKTSGVLEAEFFGTSEADLNGFRLRQAYTKLDWGKTSLLIGQAWHPMFPTECYPATVSFNTGAPFTPFSRNPQVRFTYNPGRFSAAVTAYSQRDFTSTGPDGSGNKYMRNSGLPGLNAQVRILVTSAGFALIGGDLKAIRPELRTSENFENLNTLSSLAGFATLHLKTKPVSVTLMGTYVQNATDLTMIGGYGVADIIDTLTGIRTFSNLTTASGWIDLYTNGEKIQAGLFAGYSKNLGSASELNGPLYGRGTNIDYVARISPRLLFISGKFTFSAEFETTFAAYGTPDSFGKIMNSEPVTNYRMLLAATYKF
ncbi:MAG: DcaP family trimeric outer membrane transporter [Bacteroidota bacterium]